MGPTCYYYKSFEWVFTGPKDLFFIYFGPMFFLGLRPMKCGFYEEAAGTDNSPKIQFKKGPLQNKKIYYNKYYDYTYYY